MSVVLVDVVFYYLSIINFILIVTFIIFLLGYLVNQCLLLTVLFIFITYYKVLMLLQLFSC